MTIDHESYGDGLRVRHISGGDTVAVHMLYPRSEGHVRRVVVGMECVRAADNITITYDFERDGYAITQEVCKEGDGCMEPTGEIREVAFVPAWCVGETPDLKETP